MKTGGIGPSFHENKGKQAFIYSSWKISLSDCSLEVVLILRYGLIRSTLFPGQSPLSLILLSL